MFNPSALEQRFRPPQDSSGPPRFSLIVAYDVIYLVDLVLVLLLIFTAWFFRIRRTSTWYAALSTSVLSCVASLLLLGQQHGAAPPPGSHICLVQASLIYSVVILDGLYSFSFILQAYLILRNAVKSQQTIPPKYIAMLHIVPCTSFIGIFSGFLLYGLLNPWTPQRSPTGMYCHISSPGPREIAGAIAIVAMVLIIAVEALIIITLRRISGSFRSLFRNDAYIAPDGLVRVIIFSVGPFLAIVVSGAQYFDKTDAQTADLSILLALVPFFIVVVFGSQKDIVRAWLSCCRRDPTLLL